MRRFHCISVRMVYRILSLLAKLHVFAHQFRLLQITRFPVAPVLRLPIRFGRRFPNPLCDRALKGWRTNAPIGSSRRPTRVFGPRQGFAMPCRFRRPSKQSRTHAWAPGANEQMDRPIRSNRYSTPITTLARSHPRTLATNPCDIVHADIPLALKPPLAAKDPRPTQHPYKIPF